MLVTRTRTALMAGAATLSLTVAGWASEFSSVLVFGDRQLDAGQFVDDTTVFNGPDEPVTTDGRGRFVHRDADGNTGHGWATLVSRNLGYGDTHPNQPQVLPNSPPVQTGMNYAAGFFNSEQILSSIVGTSNLFNIIYANEDGETATVPGTSELGFLVDPDTQGWAANSIVLMNGGSTDIRNLANLESGHDGTIYRNSPANPFQQALRLETDDLAQGSIAQDAATNISTGATLLRDAGAGLVLVANLPDQGAIPESTSEVVLAQRGLDQLNTARADALAADPAAIESADDQRARSIFEQIIADPTLVSSIRTEGTDTFNQTLSANLSNQNGIVLLDQNALVADVMANPARFGFSATVDHSVDCLIDSTLLPCNEVTGSVDEMLFFNGLEPTTAYHEMMADFASAVMDAPVQVSGAPFVSIASGRAVANAGTGQVAPERIAQRGWAPFVSGGIGQSNWNPVAAEGQQGALPMTGVAGVTYSFGNGVAVGAAGAYQGISNAKSEYATGYSGDAIYGTVFAGADFGRVFGSASATVGTVDYDRIERRSNIAGATIINGGSTDADVYGGSIEVGVRALTSGTVAAGPIASVDHWSADVAGYDEDGARYTAASYDGFDGSSTRASLGMFLEAGDIANADMPAVFRIKALYTRELEADGIDVSARSASSPTNTFTREGRSGEEDSITVGAQLTYDFGPIIGSLGYDARIGESDDHYGRLDISVPINGAIR